MRITDLQKNWDDLGEVDPFWAILAYPEQQGNKWDRDEFFATGRTQVDEVLATVATACGEPASTAYAVDFGCGAGRLTLGLARHYDRVSGVDIAPSMIELANELNSLPQRVDYRLNERPDLSLLPDQSVDFLLSIVVLQHMSNDLKRSYLAEFVRILRPGATAAFTIPSHADWSPIGMLRRLPNPIQNIYRRWRHGYSAVMEMHLMRRREVEAVLQAHGAIVEHVEEESMAGPPFTSYLYVIRRPHSSMEGTATRAPRQGT